MVDLEYIPGEHSHDHYTRGIVIYTYFNLDKPLSLSASVLQFSGLYLLAFVIIILGLVLFSSSSTYVAQDPRVYKQFRNTGGQAATDQPAFSPGVLEPSVTYTSLGPEAGEELPVRVA